MLGVAKKVRVLNFHGVGTPGRDLDPGEDDYWISADRFRFVIERIAAHPDRDRMSITFDDGNISDYTTALPELERHGLTAEFFILTGRIGKAEWMTETNIRALRKMGMRIGSHGVDHQDWSVLSARELERELRGSKERLEDVCGEPVRSASIPFGRYNAGVLTALKRAGYTSVYSSEGGTAATSAFLKPRTSIRYRTTDAMLEWILSGRTPAWRRLRRTAQMTMKKWSLA
ncbi:MAG TPA: polysaccharide deacetylase family protein [Rhizobiaceae bacterium]|nr:polysaccharide deacetylase family protein [Rhizobiaceae bacterium]